MLRGPSYKLGMDVRDDFMVRENKSHSHPFFTLLHLFNNKKGLHVYIYLTIQVQAIKAVGNYGEIFDANLAGFIERQGSLNELHPSITLSSPSTDPLEDCPLHQGNSTSSGQNTALNNVVDHGPHRCNHSHTDQPLTTPHSFTIRGTGILYPNVWGWKQGVLPLVTRNNAANPRSSSVKSHGDHSSGGEEGREGEGQEGGQPQQSPPQATQDAQGNNVSTTMLGIIREQGYLTCCVPFDDVHFGLWEAGGGKGWSGGNTGDSTATQIPHALEGTVEGFDADMCRAMAAAIFEAKEGKPLTREAEKQRIEWVDTGETSSTMDSLVALSEGRCDLVTKATEVSVGKCEAEAEAEAPGRRTLYTPQLPVRHGWLLGVIMCVFVLYTTLSGGLRLAIGKEKSEIGKTDIDMWIEVEEIRHPLPCTF